LVGVVARGAVFVGISVLLARYIIPHVLHAVAATKSRELFTLTVAGLCMGVAFLAALMGLSVVLGAFVAGLAVSECMYKHRILSDIAPIKDLFLTIFFRSASQGLEHRAVRGGGPDYRQESSRGSDCAIPGFELARGHRGRYRAGKRRGVFSRPDG
jgi:hypothetical protein